MSGILRLQQPKGLCYFKSSVLVHRPICNAATSIARVLGCYQESETVGVLSKEKPLSN